MYKGAFRSPYFIFFPFLLFYAYVIVINKWPTLYGDEIRYVDFAHNLIHGFYSPPMPHINLWNGPGYPLVLYPFIKWKIPVLYITLLNALYQYLAVVFLYKAIKLITSHKTALIFSLLLAVYPNVLAILPILYTEALTFLLISLLIYSVTLCYTRQSYNYVFMAGLVLGFLTLTKVIFGYVLFICIAAGVVMLLFKKNRPYYVKMVSILLLAITVTIPYLSYTQHLTGKLFYWGDAGGMSLYWMSSPYEHEYGDWKVPDLTNNQYPSGFVSEQAIKQLKKNHATELNFILKHNEMEQDQLFKQFAIRNIETHPLKFITNYYYNVARMLFNFPYSYSSQDGAIVGNIIRGSLILWGSIIGMICTFVNWRRIIFPVKLLLFVTAVYLLLSGALSAYPRQLDVVVPVLLFWIAYLGAKGLGLNLRFTQQLNLDEIDLTDLPGIALPSEEKLKHPGSL